MAALRIPEKPQQPNSAAPGYSYIHSGKILSSPQQQRPTTCQILPERGIFPGGLPTAILGVSEGWPGLPPPTSPGMLLKEHSLPSPGCNPRVSPRVPGPGLPLAGLWQVEGDIQCQCSALPPTMPRTAISHSPSIKKTTSWPSRGWEAGAGPA